MIKFLTCSVILLIFNVCAMANPSLKIALVAPFSGHYSAYGTQLLSGAMQATTDINVKGGIGGMLIDIIPIDDQCNPDIAIQVATDIVQSKEYAAVIGHVCSAATLASSNIYAKANMLLITPTSTNNKITERKFDTVFRMTGNDDEQSLAAAEFIANTLKCKRVAILHDHELYSKDLADLVSAQLLQMGATPVLYQGITRGTRNFTPIIKKLNVLEADAIYFAGLYPEIASLAKTLDLLELQIPIITADGIAINKFLDMASTKLASSILMTFADNPSNLVSSQVVINRMQANQLETTGYALYAYAAIEVLAQAFANANTTDGHKLANWLHQHEVDTVLGKKSWDTNGNINNAQFKIYNLIGANTLSQLAQ